MDLGAGEGIGDGDSWRGIEKDEAAVGGSEEGEISWGEVGFVEESGESDGFKERDAGVEEEGRKEERGGEAAPATADGVECGEVADGEEAAGYGEEGELREIGPTRGEGRHGGDFFFLVFLSILGCGDGGKYEEARLAVFWGRNSFFLFFYYYYYFPFFGSCFGGKCEEAPLEVFEIFEILI